MNQRKLAVAVCAFVLVTSCVTPSDEEALIDVDPTLHTQSFGHPVCPVTSAAEKQRIATDVVGYLLGAAYTFPMRGSCASARHDASVLRRWIGAGWCSLGASNDVPTTVCGLPAGELTIRCETPAVLTWVLISSTAENLDRCFGSGVSGFFHSGFNGEALTIDPTPARLTEDLAGPTGTTASAYYTTDLSPTTVVKWPASYLSGVSPPAAGVPCSTVDLLTNSLTTHIIQASGVYRRCL